MNMIETVEAAVRLGIKVTRAPLATEIWNAWADRIQLAERQFQRGEDCHEMIQAANEYAI